MTIRRVKFSVLWHQHWLPRESLVETMALDRTSFEETVAIARREQTGPLTSPWPVTERQKFWEFYLGRSPTLEGAPVRDVFRFLVPLRSAGQPLELLADGDDTRAATEGFLHHWGGTLVINLALAGDWGSLAEVADRIVQLRREPCFSTSPGGPQRRLDDLAADGLAALRPQAVKAIAGATSDGFSVFSLTTAAGEPTDFDPTVEATGAHLFLHAVTSFSSIWRSEKPRPLGEAAVGGKKTGPTSHFLYGAARGRAIWSPENFAVEPAVPGAPPPPRRKPTVGCHHRNLVLASMQTEALARFAADAADRLHANLALSSQHDLLARLALGKLDEIYAGDRSTYRSGSLRAQIDDAQLKGPIDAARAKNGWSALG